MDRRDEEVFLLNAPGDDVSPPQPDGRRSRPVRSFLDRGPGRAYAIGSPVDRPAKRITARLRAAAGRQHPGRGRAARPAAVFKRRGLARRIKRQPAPDTLDWSEYGGECPRTPRFPVVKDARDLFLAANPLRPPGAGPAVAVAGGLGPYENTRAALASIDLSPVRGRRVLLSRTSAGG